MVVNFEKVFGHCSVFVACVAVVAVAQPFQPGYYGVVPLGNLDTSDFGGPYNISLLSTQANEVKAAIAQRKNYTDQDIIEFLTNVECLEGLFDSYGTLGRGFVNGLEMGGPTPIGARYANLSDDVRMHLMEVAISEQGHALFTRHAGSEIPCPLINYTAGFNELMAAAYELPSDVTVEDQFGAPFDPFQNDETFIISMLTLEELGATGNKGLIGLASNPVIANGIAGLATSATAFAAVERMLLWQRRDNLVPPFNESAAQVFARVSAYRDRMDGPQIDDQGIYNTDPRFIAVPFGFVNMIPTDVRGLTFSRTPGMNINVLTIGSPSGRGGFFPEGLGGAIKTPDGYDEIDGSGTEQFPTQGDPQAVASALNTETTVDPPIEGSTPTVVPGQDQLTQAYNGPFDNGTAYTRGLDTPPETAVYYGQTESTWNADQSSTSTAG